VYARWTEAPDSELIPLFPLHTVLFPGGVLPLHIFEDRYRLLVREARDFGVVLIRQGREVGPGQGDDIHQVGTLATFQEVEALPDGRFFVVARGVRRIRVVGLDHSRPYLTGRVETLADPPARAGPRLLNLLDAYLAAHGVEVAPHLSAGQGKRAVWLVGSVLQTEPSRRQQLLEECDPQLAEQLLREELAKLSALGKVVMTQPRQPPRN
jgi:uncharacterized protein